MPRTLDAQTLAGAARQPLPAPQAPVATGVSDDREALCRPAWHEGLQAGHRSGHVESYFLKWNDLRQQRAVWIKFTFYVPTHGHTQHGMGPAHQAATASPTMAASATPEAALPGPMGEVWAVWFDGRRPAFNRAWKQRFALSQCEVEPQPLRLRFGDSTLQAQASEGQIKGPQGVIRWHMQWDAGEPALRHFPHSWMYKAPFPKSKLTAPNPSSLFSGWVEIDGRLVAFERCPGTLGHNWGREHAHHYAWAHCNAFEGHGSDTWFEGLSSQLRIGSWTTPYLSLAHLQIDGRRYTFDRLRHVARADVAVTPTRWQFRMESREYALVGELTAPPERFMCLHYPNPDGELGYCLNSKQAHAWLELRNRHEQVMAQLRCPAAAALEVLVRDPNHGIRFGA